MTGSILNPGYEFSVIKSQAGESKIDFNFCFLVEIINERAGTGFKIKIPGEGFWPSRSLPTPNPSSLNHCNSSIDSSFNTNKFISNPASDFLFVQSFQV